jgi:hypothetical protein
MAELSRKLWFRIIGPFCLVILSCLIGALLAEAAYRVYLVRKHADRFSPPEREKIFGASNLSLWEFDERFGYVYPASRVIDYVAVADGYVHACERSFAINELGNIGSVAGDWKNADLKIAVFGDSWSAFQQQGLTWPNFLQKILATRIKRPVAVMNFGRDGYGVLQMFDLAAAKVVEWKPDIVIIAFITDDLTRARFWRTVVGQGDDQRVLTTIDPVRNPREDRAVDTNLLMSSASYEWCKAMEGTKRVDPILSRLVEKDRLLRQRTRSPNASAWDVRHSYLFNRLWRGKQFWHVDNQWRPEQNPRHAYSSYAEDARLMAALRQLLSLGSKLVLFHLAFYPEINANREYLASPQEQALLRSLESISGGKILRTTDYVSMPVERPGRLNASPDDRHPSLWGMEFYANAVAEALIREKVVERREP